MRKSEEDFSLYVFQLSQKGTKVVPFDLTKRVMGSKRRKNLNDEKRMELKSGNENWSEKMTYVKYKDFAHFFHQPKTQKGIQTLFM